MAMGMAMRTIGMGWRAGMREWYHYNRQRRNANSATTASTSSMVSVLTKKIVEISMCIFVVESSSDSEHEGG